MTTLLILFLIIAVASAAFVIFFLPGLCRDSRRNHCSDQQPIASAPTRVVAKRSDFAYHVHDGEISGFYSYYATFETANKERYEYLISSEEYELLVVGGQGTLIFQGTHYKGFKRQHIP